MPSFATTTPASDRTAMLRRLVVGLASTVAVAGASAAVTVGFTATNLADTVAGQDLWRYDYTVSGGLGEGEAVNLLFSPASYAELTLLSSDARLAALASEPSPTVPFDGTVMLLALFAIAAADPAPTAALQFVWSGSGAPGTQPFEHLNDSFNVVGTGFTTPSVVIGPGPGPGPQPVPEPGTAAMLASGLMALGWMARRRAVRPH